jgi:hypothetical protein
MEEPSLQSKSKEAPQTVVLSQTRPEDFSLRLYYDTGPLPTAYFYYYSIDIGPGNVGLFEFLPGRGEPSAPPVYLEEFTVSTKDLDTLYSYFKENNVLKNDWQQEESLDGAPNISLAVTANGQLYRTGQIPELASEDYRTANNAFEYVIGVVPQEIWSKMQDMQDRFIESYEYEQ